MDTVFQMWSDVSTVKDQETGTICVLEMMTYKPKIVFGLLFGPFKVIMDVNASDLFCMGRGKRLGFSTTLQVIGRLCMVTVKQEQNGS